MRATRLVTSLLPGSTVVGNPIDHEEATMDRDPQPQPEEQSEHHGKHVREDVPVDGNVEGEFDPFGQDPDTELAG